MESTCVANSKNDLAGAQNLPGATESLSNQSQSDFVPLWPPWSEDSLGVSDLFTSWLAEENRRAP
jgi:hypothetical protein